MWGPLGAPKALWRAHRLPLGGPQEGAPKGGPLKGYMIRLAVINLIIYLFRGMIA